jgi:superfamily II DNA or RNA helicase
MRKVRAQILALLLSFYLPPYLPSLLHLSPFPPSHFLSLIKSVTNSIIMLPRQYWDRSGQAINSPNPRAPSSSRLHDQLDAVMAAPLTPKIKIKASFELRDFQADAIDAVLHALTKDNLKCIGVSAPAGSGKTTIFTMLIPLIPKLDEGDKVLIIVPYVHLIRQTEDVIRKRFPKRYQIGIEQGATSAHPDDDM